MQIKNPEEIEQKKRVDSLKQEIFTKYLTKEARERLGSIRYAHPETAENVENMILQAALSNKLKGVIDDKKLKELLEAISVEKKESRITFNRKI
jgi:DNA-binding TFAR19-related protein (PDSD5 family)